MDLVDLGKELTYKGVLDVYKGAIFSLSYATIIP